MDGVVAAMVICDVIVDDVRRDGPVVAILVHGEEGGGGCIVISPCANMTNLCSCSISSVLW